MARYAVVLIVATLALLTLFVWAENSVSQKFHDCVHHTSAEQTAESANQDSLGVALVSIGRIIRSQSVCSLYLVDRHNGFFAALSALAIAAFTVLLVAVTSEQAKLTAASVRIAERALIDLEGPVLQVIDIFVSISTPLSDADFGHTSHFKIKNYGRTPAVLREVSFQWGKWKSALDSPQYGDRRELLAFVGQGEIKRMTPEDIGRADTGFAYGYLKYSDLFGAVHTTGFGLRRGNQTDAWLISGGPVYNYHRVEREPNDKG